MVTNNIEDTISPCHGVCASSKRKATDIHMLPPRRCGAFLVKTTLNDQAVDITMWIMNNDSTMILKEYKLLCKKLKLP